MCSRPSSLFRRPHWAPGTSVRTIAPLEAQPNEADDLAEPAEHIDDVNIFFFINYLVEYMLDIHRRADTVHNRVGQGDFPDNFPNSDRPLSWPAAFPE